MDFKGIELNKKYRYHQLCDILGESKKTGNSKIYQLKEWERFVNITKCEKANFIITEIYDVPKEKKDGRINNGHHENSRNQNSIYMEHIDPILQHIFTIQQEKTTYTSLNQLAKSVCMINDNYIEYKDSIDGFFKCLSEKKEISNYTAINNIFYHIINIIKPAINSSLDRLHKKGIIELEKGYIINEKYKVNLTELRLATEKEEKVIKDIQKRVKEEMEIYSYNDLINDSRLRKEYYKKVDELIKSEFDYIDYIFQGYEITKKKDISEHKCKEIREHKEELNSIVKSRIIDKITYKHDKIKEEVKEKSDKMAFGEPILKLYEIEIADDNYKKDCKTVLNYLTDISAKRVSKKTEQTKRSWEKDKEEEIEQLEVMEQEEIEIIEEEIIDTTPIEEIIDVDELLSKRYKCNDGMIEIARQYDAVEERHRKNNYTVDEFLEDWEEERKRNREKNRIYNFDGQIIITEEEQEEHIRRSKIKKQEIEWMFKDGELNTELIERKNKEKREKEIKKEERRKREIQALREKYPNDFDENGEMIIPF